MRKWLVPGIVAAVLLAALAVFGYRTIKQNRPAPYWVEIQLRAPENEEQVKSFEKACRERMTSDDWALPVSRELGLARQWKLPDEHVAAAELKRRIFVRFNRSGLLKIGANGKVKEARTTEAVANALGRKFAESLKQPKAAAPGF
jgi:hypothetical protein